MFGYATDETEECMPLTIVLAHKLNEKMSELRRNGIVPWLRADSKTQVRSCNMCTFFTYPKHNTTAVWELFLSSLDIFH